MRSSFKEEVDVQMAKMEETVTVQCCVDQKTLRVDGEGRGGEGRGGERREGMGEGAVLFGAPLGAAGMCAMTVAMP